MASFWDMQDKLRPRGGRAGQTPAAKSAQPAPAGADATLTVTELTTRIKGALERGLPARVLVRGEVSEWSNAASGHRYFCLKDDRTSISCVMWQSDARSLRFEPQVGQELLATGQVDVYFARGQYQLRCLRLEPVGQGALELAFRQMVEKLRGEGLFEADRKKPLPAYPRTICILTSPQAAGYADVVKVLSRYRHLRRLLYPIPVQGAGAGERIAEALKHVDRRHRDVGGVDVILLCRGGGSAEDLWAFNEEPVARALAGMSVPVITGIGHETDTSIADLVADYHAHTPTEAAQVLIKHWRNAPDRVDQLGILLRREWRDAQRARRQMLEGICRHETFRRPVEGIQRRRQLLDERSTSLSHALRRLARATRQRLEALAGVLHANHPRQRLVLARRSCSELGARLANAWRGMQERRARRLDDATIALERGVLGRLAHQDRQIGELALRMERRGPESQVRLIRERLLSLGRRLEVATRHDRQAREARVGALAGRLRALDPTAVLGRGYTITLVARTGRVLRAAAEVRPGDVLLTRTADGEVQSTAGESHQGQLFD